MRIKFNELLPKCDGIEKITNKISSPSFPCYIRTGPVTVPSGYFVEIFATATAGTFGKLIGIDTKAGWSGIDDRNVNLHSGTLIVQCDNRKKPIRIHCSHANILTDYMGSLNYIRIVTKHKPVVVKAPVNKFKQELKRGDWVVGIAPGRALKIGRITRWTNHNVWAVMNEHDLDDKSKEFKFDGIHQTFLMPSDDHTSSLTMAVLKGWDGR